MLEAFVDLVMERRRRDPGMHVYHYGGYESGALKRLMQRHATREDEIDVLLRGHVLVNLYDHVVRQGIRASVESYSIKKLETFYMPRARGRDHAGRLLGRRVRALDGAEQDPAILDAIAAYNRDDCISNLLLRDWLEARRDEALETHPEWYPDGEVPRPSLGGRRGSAKVARGPGRDAGARGCAARGRARWTGSSARPSSRAAGCSPRCSTGTGARRSPSGGTTSGSSRRRSTTSWRDGSALGGAARSSPTSGAIDKSALHRYRFDPAQDSKIVEGKSYIALAPNADGSGWDTSAVDGRRARSRSPGRSTSSATRATRHPVALIPTTPYGDGADARRRCGRLADHVDRARARGTRAVPRGARPRPPPAAADRRASSAGRRARPGRRRHDADRAGPRRCGSTRPCSRSRDRPGPARPTRRRG